MTAQRAAAILCIRCVRWWCAWFVQWWPQICVETAVAPICVETVVAPNLRAACMVTENLRCGAAWRIPPVTAPFPHAQAACSLFAHP